MSQAIFTKYLGPTDTRPSRIKAWCERGSITVPFCQDSTVEAAHYKAVVALVAKFAREDKENGQPLVSNPWLRKMIAGGYDKGFVFVFVY